jgi:hypothetical protein
MVSLHIVKEDVKITTAVFWESGAVQYERKVRAFRSNILPTSSDF